MKISEYSEIRQELSDIKRESALSKRNPIFDVGVFILAYFFFLTVVAVIMLVFDFPIGMYNCAIALLPTWILIAWLRRAPFYSFVILVIGIIILILCMLIVSQIYDIRWDSNSYHKPNVGLLANGWNPFDSSMMDYSNTSGFLPETDNWRAHQVDTQPKASFIIGASFYALSRALVFIKNVDFIDLSILSDLGIHYSLEGAIEYGRIFNLASMIACLFIVSPLLRDALKMRRVPAIIIVLLVVFNPVSLIQLFTYYNDSFLFQILTITAACFGYLAMKPEGPYSVTCKYIGFIAVCLAINIKTSALIYCAIICFFYYISYLRSSGDIYPEIKIRRKYNRRKFVYWVAMVVVAVGLLGSVTYIVNAMRYGSPVYGMLGDTSINSMIQGEMSEKVRNLPKIAQVFVSLFSPSENKLFTDIALKIPFTLTQSELGVDAVVDTRMSGWGVLYSGIFIVSLAIIFITLKQIKRKKWDYFKVLLASVLLILLPTLFIPHLWWARYYSQLFWISTLALCCLFAPRINKGSKKLLQVFKVTLGVVLCGLLVLNMYPQGKEVLRQYELAEKNHEEYEKLRKLNEWYYLEVSLPYDEFYGMLFNLQDEGLTDYKYTLELDEQDGTLMEYVAYDLKWRNSESEEKSRLFLSNLKDNGYTIFIVANGECTKSLDFEMRALMKYNGLEFDMKGAYKNSYIAVIDSNGEVLHEQKSENRLDFSTTIKDIPISLVSSGGLNDSDISTIDIDGIDFANNKRGYNIVVYDFNENTLIDSVHIDSYWDNSLKR